MSKAAAEIGMPDLCRALVDASPMPTALVDGTHHIVRYTNPAFCALLNQLREELVGRELAVIVPVETELLALLERVYGTGKSEAHAGQEECAGCSLFWSYTVWPVVGAENRVLGMMLQVTKCTLDEHVVAMNEALLIGSVRQHQLIEVAERLNAHLKTEMIERRRAEEEMRQFAYAASHDLQEPLRTVTSFTQLLAKKLRPHFDPEAEQFVQYIVEGNSRMLTLIKDLLAYAQAGEERSQDAKLIPCGKAVEQALAALKGSIEEACAEITVADSLPSVNADLGLLTQVFQNLIGNALKYRKRNCAPKIHIAAEARGDEQVLSVRDNGIGFLPKYSEQIFGIFKRLHGMTEYPGTGIGLAICKRIVERQGGRIWATGEDGIGATFYFTIPTSQALT